MTVNENISAIRYSDGELHWWRAGLGQCELLDPTSDAFIRASQSKTPCFAVPADQVRLLTLNVDPIEAKHLSQSLPFMLEDEVVDDIGELHFARQSLGENRWLVAVVRREDMLSWTELLGADFAGRWLPESLLLPWHSGEICIVVEGQSALVRYDEMLGCRVELSLLAPLLEAIVQSTQGAGEPADTSETPAAPSVVLYGQSQSEDIALLPESLRSGVQWRQGNFASALMVANPELPNIDLRQGEFAPRLPLAKWWGHWRRVAVAAGVTLVLALGADIAEYQRLKSENMALRGAIQSSYRLANPKGAVVDAEKQLDRQLAEFTPASTGARFTPMLAAVTGAVAEDAGISISTLNFSASAAEVRLDLIAGDYATVEGLRRRLTAAGFNATLETSSSRDDQVRARLRVEA